jgi:tetratricopeptide (TPR) repeat protein
MNGYKYNSEKAKELLGKYCAQALNNEFGNEDQLSILKEIARLEPDIEDATYFYFLGNEIKNGGDEEKAIKWFEKSYKLNEKYNEFDSNYMTGHCVNREIGIYNFTTRKKKATNEFERKEAYSLAKKHFEKALEYHSDNADKSHQLMREMIRRCDMALNPEQETTTSTSGTNVSSGNEDKSGCFIATAVYGSYDCLEVRILRSFRDNLLLKYKLGRKSVSAYYQYSPPIAKYLTKKTRMPYLIKHWVLNPVVKTINKFL